MSKKFLRTDEQLAELINKGDTQAAAELYDRYKIYSWQIAHERYELNPQNGISTDEYFTCAFESLAIAVQKYDKTKGRALYPYWKSIVDNEIIDLINDQSYTCGAKAFAGISLDSSYNEDSLLNEERYGFEEPRQSFNGLIDEMFSIIFDQKNKFTPREQQVLMCLLHEYTKEEIMDVLNLSVSTYNYHFRRASAKLKAILGIRD